MTEQLTLPQVKCYLESIVALTVERSMRECLEEEDVKLSR